MSRLPTDAPPLTPAPVNNGRYKVLLIALGALVPLLVAVLHFMPGTFRVDGVTVGFLPPLIAVINSLTALALLAGYYFIRRQDVARHRLMMGLAFGLGTIFLLAYVTYHSQAASTRYGGDGLLRYVYYTLLLSHIVLAIITVGLVLFTLYFALTQQFARHRRIARWTFPIWFYVSVSGVLVYFLISPYYPA